MSDAGYPDWLLAQIREIAPQVSGEKAAQLLWQRGLQEPEAIAGFLDPDQYAPTGPDAFGPEIEWAIARLEQARETGEIVTIWGDFDADGITATAVLWEGLGHFFSASHLNYVIPNRITESHGLNCRGIERLHQDGTTLIVTCDTGCTHLDEITLAHQFGIDVIVTDHHTLPAERPPVVAMLNPRQFSAEHPLATLSGVAVAYKLVEAWYDRRPDIPRQPLTELLDLVAIGLIADLVELKKDCRYLAQKGLQTLKTRLQNPSSRPGVARLLSLCQKAGDRPTDISFGIGPRINAVSRIHGDASFCVELLTCRDPDRCSELAVQTELANSRRKALQQRIKQEAIAEIEKLDLAHTQVIVIAKRQWPVGILGLVAGEIAQTWQRPTLLMQIETDASGVDIARGSARSVKNIDLYELMHAQSHLFLRFGGHPFAAGFSLFAENIDLLSQALNHVLRLRQHMLLTHAAPYDLVVTIDELGHTLFKELQLLEPCGMGNRTPRLLIRNAWFEQISHRNLRDRNGSKLKYIQATFSLRDDSSAHGFPGIWWEQYQENIPRGRCNVLVELDFNNHQRQPEIRVIQAEVRQSCQEDAKPKESKPFPIEILDHRNTPLRSFPDNALILNHCPQSWNELSLWIQRSRLNQQALILAFAPSCNLAADHTWQQLVGFVKAAITSNYAVSRTHLCHVLEISDETLSHGLDSLKSYGISIHDIDPDKLTFKGQWIQRDQALERVTRFMRRVEEERYQQQYFQHLPHSLIRLITLES